MRERMLDHCIALCRQARDLDGAAQLQVLSTLEHALEDLRVGLKKVSQDANQISVSIETKPTDPVITMDLAGYITGWNEGAERLFGYSAEEAIGQHVLFLYADGDDDVAREMMERTPCTPWRS